MRRPPPSFRQREIVSDVVVVELEVDEGLAVADAEDEGGALPDRTTVGAEMRSVLDESRRHLDDSDERREDVASPRDGERASR